MTDNTHPITNTNPLAGKTVRLTAIEPGDIPALASWYRDAGFVRLWDATPAYPRTQKQIEDYITEQQKSPSAFTFAIRPVDSEAVIGTCDLDGIVWSLDVAWMSIGIGDPAWRGRGCGSDALDVLLRFAFGELNLRRVQLTVFSYNATAIHLYEKFGFQREGTYREFLQRDGQLYDMLLYGLLRREWEARNSAGGPTVP